MTPALRDAALPPGARPAAWETRTIGGVPVASARWTPATLRRVVAALAPADLDDDALLAAWDHVVALLRDPASPPRRALGPALAAAHALSPAGLNAALDVVLAGVTAAAARAVAGAARSGPGAAPPVAVVLSANVPGLAVQPLLPALLARRAVVLKSSSREPLFAPALIAELVRREPRLAGALAAVTWPGGDEALEDAAFAGAGAVVAYGGAEAMAALRARCGERLVAFGPRLSLAVVGAAADPRATARGLARDVALFDQRGCLSIQAVYTTGDAERLAGELAAALADLARELPPGPVDAAAAAAVRQVREEAALRGLWLAEPPLAAGTVVVEPEPRLVPSPGLRTVRIHPLADAAGLDAALAGWSGRLQGAAVTPDVAAAVEPLLRRLGVTRLAPPGALQAADATWENGGVSLARLLAALDRGPC